MRYLIFVRVHFLVIGALLLLFGALGWSGLLNPVSTPRFWIEPAASAAYLGLGLGFLAITLVPGLNEIAVPLYAPLVWLFFLGMLVAAVWGIAASIGIVPTPNVFGLVPPRISNAYLSLVFAVYMLNPLLAGERFQPAPTGTGDDFSL